MTGPPRPGKSPVPPIWRLPRIVALLTLPGLPLSACGPAVLPGHVWSVHLTTDRDECADPPAQYDEVLEFTVNFQGTNSIDVGTEGALFATGSIAGCALTYRTGVWEEDRDGAIIRWELEGEALYRFGGTGCELPDGVDWVGSETFTVLGSDDPAVSPGCQSVLATEGTYVGER